MSGFIIHSKLGLLMPVFGNFSQTSLYIAATPSNYLPPVSITSRPPLFATITYLEYPLSLATPIRFGQARSLGAVCLPLAVSLHTVCERSSCSKEV
jgi:hypothetical protein